MSAKANYFKIGVFVFAGMAIAVAAVVVLGAGELFEKTIKIETYFDQSVQGLAVGSPVKRRGVHIGEVEEIKLVSEEYGAADTPETMFEYGRYVFVKMSLPVKILRGRTLSNVRERVYEQIESGLRVRLAPEGITGIVYIEADYLDPERYPPLDIIWDPKEIYIPAAPGTLKTLMDSVDGILVKLEEIDVQGITQSLERDLKLLGEQIEGLGTGKISEQVQELVSDLSVAVGHMNDFLEESSGTIVKDVAATTAAVRRVVEEAERPVTTMLSEDVPETMQTANRAGEKLETATESLLELLAQLQITLRRVDATMVEERRDVADIIDNLRIVSENLKAFTEEAKAYPSRAIFGGPPTRKEQP